MIFVTLGLLGFGICDLVRWSPDRVQGLHATVAALSGTAVVVAVAALSGMGASRVILAGGVALVVLWVWSAYDLAESNTPGLSTRSRSWSA